MSRDKGQLHQHLDSFICIHCGNAIGLPESGTQHRNHCSRCLWSLHVDIRPGDRRSGCKGEMEPIGVWIRAKREWAIIHRCTKRSAVKTNRIAGDDAEISLLALALRPVMDLPFPADLVLRKMTNGAY